MNCKNCIHNEVCYCYLLTYTNNNPICCNYKDKSRFIELPCKVGADVFYPAIYPGVGEYIHVGKAVSFSFDNFVRFYARYDDGLTYWHKVANIGKTVFLAREEAEKALKERGRK